MPSLIWPHSDLLNIVHAIRQSLPETCQVDPDGPAIQRVVDPSSVQTINDDDGSEHAVQPSVGRTQLSKYQDILSIRPIKRVLPRHLP